MAQDLYVSLWTEAFERERPLVRVVVWLRSYQPALSAVETFRAARRLAGELPKPCLSAILHEAAELLSGEPEAGRDPLATLRIAAALHAQNHEFDRACGVEDAPSGGGRIVILGFVIE